jgi:hypothetical protein
VSENGWLLTDSCDENMVGYVEWDGWWEAEPWPLSIGAQQDKDYVAEGRPVHFWDEFQCVGVISRMTLLAFLP